MSNSDAKADAASQSTRCVAVIGGATSGAEVAGRLAERGAVVVVFEQNPRPYGKIEDGLPRWHASLRQKEYNNIREKLSRAGVHFVPNTSVGSDLDFADLARNWGFTAVVLACGAWRDRPLPLEGAEEWVGKGLIYQNPFIIWFNHSEENDYQGPTFEVKDGAIVVGGGLASIDVAKVLTLECTRQKMRERGVELPLVELEVKGIPKTLAAHGTSLEELGIEGCTLLYRRSAQDMPLMDAPEGATPDRVEKVRKGRERMLAKAMEKYCFKFAPLSMPDAPLIEEGRLVGLRVRRTKMENGRPVPTDDTYEIRGSCVISSIGSIPERIPGIPTKGELFEFTDWDFGRLDGYPTVFSVGNVVTGKGNIVASRKHAIHVSEEAIERYLGLAEGDPPDLFQKAAAEEAERVAEQIGKCAPTSAETIAAILERVRERQKTVGYDDFESWMARVSPADLA